MVLNELIPMLAAQGLDTSRGRFPGLVDGRLRRAAAGRAARPGAHGGDLRCQPGAVDVVRRARRPVRSTAPTTSPPIQCAACRRSGRSRSAIDCGNSDPFYSATKQFIAQLPNPPSGGFSPGGHDGAFWSSQLPAEIDLDGAAAGRLDADLMRPSAAASPISLRKWLPGNRIDLITCIRGGSRADGQVGSGTHDGQHPASGRHQSRRRSRRAVAACSTPSASAPTMTSPTRGRPG